MELVERALQKAAILHDGQYRKGDERLPYVSHVVGVAFLARSYGASDTVVAAALLHDTVEDTDYTTEALRADFGDEVAGIVAGVTEDKTLPRAERKVAYLEGLRSAPEASAFVSACDLLHNLRSMIADLESGGAAFRTAFFTPEAVALYEKRITIITERLGASAPLLPELATAYDTFITLVHS